MKILFDCHWNESLWQRLRFMTVAKVILHGAFLARVSVCAIAVVCAPNPGNASPAYLASTHSRSPRSLGASEKAAKAPAESRGKPVEGAAAAPKSHRRSGPDPNPAPSLRHSSRPLHPTAAAARVALLRWSWCDAAQWVLTAPADTGEAVKKRVKGGRRVRGGRRIETQLELAKEGRA